MGGKKIDAKGFAMVEAYVDACAPTSPGALIPTVEERAHPVYRRIELSLVNCVPCDAPASGCEPERGSKGQ